MEAVKFRIEKEVLRAILLFVSKDQLRPAMNGVCIYPESKGAWIVATDAHKLGAYYVEDIPALPEPIILPANIVKQVSAKTNKIVDEVIFAIGGGLFKITDPATLITFDFQPIAEKFPLWKSVIPSVKDEEYKGFADFDAEKLIAFNKAMKVFGYGGTPMLFPTGEKRAAMVRFYEDDNFMGLIMPAVQERRNESLTDKHWVYNIFFESKN